MIPIYLWHPILVHFTVGLLSVATVFYVLSRLLPKARLRPQWLTVAEWNLWLGVGVALLTMLFGWIAFQTVDHDEHAHELIQTHAAFALATGAGFGALTVWSIWHRKSGSYPSWLFTGLMLVCVALLGATGLRGGDLVYQHGVAVTASEEHPEPEHHRDEGKAHPH